jgi:hypothetical protein
MSARPTYRLRFFFDTGSGVCLWSGKRPPVNGTTIPSSLVPSRCRRTRSARWNG